MIDLPPSWSREAEGIDAVAFTDWAWMTPCCRLRLAALALGPVGDARDFLRGLIGRAPLEDLAAAWLTVQRVRVWEWALGLCVRVGGELVVG
ncbi:hypothetical protein [Streptomyces sp. NBC_00259]|uniref:hypothetical protein n=1 Tax=Streptomyces sp. NBC_00259 TaxID=2903643 RepID=UPI002E29828F|nr:hypothetical protein [Streptomyces sp. NBC_00259]